MNCEVFKLKELDVEQFEIQDVLQCILHSIMFHRALGLIYPKNVDSELFEITYICVSFYESKNKQTSWFTKNVERCYWEHWYINLSVAHNPKADSGKSHHSKVVNLEEGAPNEREVRHSGLESSLREVLLQIINFVNEKKDHIPSIENLEGTSFPFEITISSLSDSAFGMELLKRMLPHGNRPCSADFQFLKGSDFV
nr:autophagy-related protein 101 isoform X4 [Solanum lycopersicum]